MLTTSINNYSINVSGKLLLLHQPIVMGIINVTPDSFYDTSRSTVTQALSSIDQQLQQGATIIDIGGASSKPNAEPVAASEELSRVLPVVTQAIKLFPNAILSIDTTNALVAQATLDAGASIINDISAGLQDANMLSTVAKNKCPYILMHMQGSPSTMQLNPNYGNVVMEVFSYLNNRIKAAHSAGINDVIADVGFGFGKNLQHNYELLNMLAYFKQLGVPLLAGVSRKSMLYKLLDITLNDALNATTAANTIALMNGALILRVHDVKAAVEAIKIVNALKQ
jgi:dihydropteroate synthase